MAQDYGLAVEWYRKAAAQGFAKAITNLGVMYENGFGVEADEQEAMRLYRLGGQQEAGSSDAALDQIGFAFDGRAANQMPAAYLPAAERGDTEAQATLASLLLIGPEQTRDLRAAARWYRAAAERGHAVAMANLGLLYMKGWGVPQDYVLGTMWINLAAASGLEHAAKLRDAAAGKLTPAQTNEAQQLASKRWAEIAAPRKAP